MQLVNCNCIMYYNQSVLKLYLFFQSHRKTIQHFNLLRSNKFPMLQMYWTIAIELMCSRVGWEKRSGLSRLGVYMFSTASRPISNTIHCTCHHFYKGLALFSNNGFETCHQGKLLGYCAAELFKIYTGTAITARSDLNSVSWIMNAIY